MVNNALHQYQNIEKEVLEGRALEAHVLLKAANILQSVQLNWESADRFNNLDQALRYNMRLWSFFQAEIEDPENPLPIELKVNLMSLTRFIDKRTIEILSDPQQEKLEVLIRINQNVAAGLNGNLPQ